MKDVNDRYIDMTHFNILEAKQSVFNYFCYRLGSRYTHRIVKGNRVGVFRIIEVRVLNLKKLIDTQKDSKYYEYVLKIKEFNEKHNGRIPNTSDTFEMSNKSVPVSDYYKKEKDKQLLNKKLRQKEFIKRWNQEILKKSL